MNIRTRLLKYKSYCACHDCYNNDSCKYEISEYEYPAGKGTYTCKVMKLTAVLGLKLERPKYWEEKEIEEICRRYELLHLKLLKPVKIKLIGGEE